MKTRAMILCLFVYEIISQNKKRNAKQTVPPRACVLKLHDWDHNPNSDSARGSFSRHMRRWLC